MDLGVITRRSMERSSTDGYRGSSASRARAFCVVGIALVATACGSASAPHSAPTSPSTTTPAHTTTTTTLSPTTTTTTRPPSTTTAIDPGLLPQTVAEPPVGASLRRALEPLWDAIVANSAEQALPVFFPEPAYLRMKEGLLPDPAADYVDRLIGFYRVDIAAYHQALGALVESTKLLSVNGSAVDAEWIPPGACENLIGYWHLPGVRLVYAQDGVVRSFAVASLISWRGVWYVVHLGPNPRPVDIGTVDQPAVGAGTPGPPGGC